MMAVEIEELNLKDLVFTVKGVFATPFGVSVILEYEESGKKVSFPAYAGRDHMEYLALPAGVSVRLTYVRPSAEPITDIRDVKNVSSAEFAIVPPMDPTPAYSEPDIRHGLSALGVSSYSAKQLAQVLAAKGIGHKLDMVVSGDMNLPMGLSATGQLAIHAAQKKYAENELAYWLAVRGLNATQAKAAQKFADEQLFIDFQKNPYLLVAVPGIGFSSAHLVAAKTGLSHDQQLVGILLHILTHYTGEGHTVVSGTVLYNHAKALSPDGEQEGFASKVMNMLEGLERMRIITRLDYEGKAEKAIVWDRDVFNSKLVFGLRAQVEAELSIIEILSKRNQRSKIIYEAPEEDEEDIKLDTSQLAAVKLAVESQVCLITGGPGTGKTTVIKNIADMVEDNGYGVVLLAPTGKAAHRISEQSGRKAQTIHSLLYSAGSAALGSQTMYIADEASMVDSSLMAALLQKIDRYANVQVALVGDADQLPPVGAGQPFQDLLASKKFPTAKLISNHRSMGQNIPVVASHVLSHDLSKFDAPDATLVRRDLSESDVLDIVKKFSEAFKTMGFSQSDVQFLGPTNRVVGAINKFVEEQRLGSRRPPKILINSFDSICVGTRIINTQNSSELGIANGDIGIVKHIFNPTPTSSGPTLEPYVVVDFDLGRVKIPQSWFENIRMAWAITIHKSQGSEFRAVAVIVPSSSQIMMSANLLYTAASRAKESLLLAIHSALKISSSRQERLTVLRLWSKQF